MTAYCPRIGGPVGLGADGKCPECGHTHPTECIACGHDLKSHGKGGCAAAVGSVGRHDHCPCRLTERVFSRAEVLAFGERVERERREETRFDQYDGLVFDPVDLAALLDGEGT